jgi:transposase
LLTPLREHQEGVFNYYAYQISTGHWKAPRPRIQLLKRQADGFRDNQNENLGPARNIARISPDYSSA